MLVKLWSVARCPNLTTTKIWKMKFKSFRFFLKWITVSLLPLTIANSSICCQWSKLSRLLKHVSAIFEQIFVFHQMIAHQKLWKFLFHLKSSFRSRDIQFFLFLSSPLFLPVSHCFRAWSKINLYDVINCLNKNLITLFVWYLEKETKYGIETLSIDRVLNEEHFHGKSMQKMCTKS